MNIEERVTRLERAVSGQDYDVSEALCAEMRRDLAAESEVTDEWLRCGNCQRDYRAARGMDWSCPWCGLDALRAQVAALEKTVQGLRAQVADLRSEVARLEAAVKDRDAMIHETFAGSLGLQGESAKLEAEVDAAAVELVRLRREVEMAHEHFTKAGIPTGGECPGAYSVNERAALMGIALAQERARAEECDRLKAILRDAREALNGGESSEETFVEDLAQYLKVGIKRDQRLRDDVGNWQRKAEGLAAELDTWREVANANERAQAANAEAQLRMAAAERERDAARAEVARLEGLRARSKAFLEWFYEAGIANDDGRALLADLRAGRAS